LRENTLREKSAGVDVEGLKAQKKKELSFGKGHSSPEGC